MVLLPILLLGLMASLSPVTIVVFVLLLRTKRAQVNGFGFLVGWGVSLAVVFAASYALGSTRASQRGSGSTAVSVLVLLLGLFLLVLAVRQWRRRGAPSRSPTAGVSPRLAQHLGTLSPWSAAVVGVLKQPWAITATAAVIVVNDHTDLLLTIIAFACFAVVSTATVGLMYLYYARSPEEAAETLTRLQDRVLAASPAVMALGGLVLGVVLVIDGLNGLVGS
jgi:Sap, sulfolipid-1-addressing protein